MKKIADLRKEYMRNNICKEKLLNIAKPKKYIR